jgi:hypothetical protein
MTGVSILLTTWIWLVYPFCWPPEYDWCTHSADHLNMTGVSILLTTWIRLVYPFCWPPEYDWCTHSADHLNMTGVLNLLTTWMNLLNSWWFMDYTLVTSVLEWQFKNHVLPCYTEDSRKCPCLVTKLGLRESLIMIYDLFQYRLV